MRDAIIETDAMLRFDDAADSVLGADKALSGFVVAYGQAGRGKSVTADRHYVKNGGVYIRVWQGWSQSDFMQRLLFEVRGTNEEMPRHRGNRCKEMIVELLDRQYKATGKRRAIYVDEADRLHVDRIEDLRDIFEMTGVPPILIGEEGIHGLMANRRRIWSRVAHEVEFGAIGAAEVALYGLQAADLDIPSTQCERIATRAEGDFRLVRNMMILLERAARAADSETVDEKMVDRVFDARAWRRS